MQSNKMPLLYCPGRAWLSSANNRHVNSAMWCCVSNRSSGVRAVTMCSPTPPTPCPTAERGGGSLNLKVMGTFQANFLYVVLTKIQTQFCDKSMTSLSIKFSFICWTYKISMVVFSPSNPPLGAWPEQKKRPHRPSTSTEIPIVPCCLSLNKGASCLSLNKGASCLSLNKGANFES